MLGLISSSCAPPNSPRLLCILPQNRKALPLHAFPHCFFIVQVEKRLRTTGGGATGSVRNLRIREDTAKYLLNLDVNSAHYDPKTRSMRADPLPHKVIQALAQFTVPLCFRPKLTLPVSKSPALSNETE